MKKAKRMKLVKYGVSSAITQLHSIVTVFFISLVDVPTWCPHQLCMHLHAHKKDLIFSVLSSLTGLKEAGKWSWIPLPSSCLF